MIKTWIEAMRLRTLPVSVAGVLAAVAMAIAYQCFQWLPALLCLAFAILAQISSNFANEYYDFKAGLDRPGREGPRRGVTEGDITPQAMKRATYLVLGIACCIGLSLLYWGGWWLLFVGVGIALGALAYSAGPYPLSRHALGEVAVLCFFGIIPVNLTYYVQSGTFTMAVFLASLAFGLMGANVLLVNNYRDIDDDKSVGKITLSVIIGRKATLTFYLLNSLMAGGLIVLATRPAFQSWSWICGVCYFIGCSVIAMHMNRLHGHALNPYLGRTSLWMLTIACLMICSAFR